MGGHAFQDLNCPRISPEVYERAKFETKIALQKIFAHVVVPTEIPQKIDYGDIDFLVSKPWNAPNSTSMDTFDWNGIIQAIKVALNTDHGFRGFRNPDCMFFAIAAPDPEEDYCIQVDVKVCFNPESFPWYTFELNYASNSKMLGSMVKPVGLTIDPEGFHIRVEEVEETNFPGSMVWISKDPKDILKVMGLDRRIIHGGFKTKNEIYEYFTSSWVFHPAHFAARLAEERYSDRLKDRSPHWIYFLREWIPEHYPGYKFINPSITATQDENMDKQKNGLSLWYKETRTIMREKVFTMFPHVAAEYYLKRSAHIEEVEERKLRDTIIKAIPTDATNWTNDLPQPKIIFNQLHSVHEGELTPATTPPTKLDQASSQDFPSSKVFPATKPCFAPIVQLAQLEDIPLYLDPLPRLPPLQCVPRPPPTKMSLEAKLLCLARWTLFDPFIGTPHLRSTPHNKDFEMHWNDAIDAGATIETLTDWAKNMWWPIWIRQCHVNFVGMWKKRSEKEDKKAEKGRLDVEVNVKEEKEKILKRLKMLNSSLGLIGVEIAEV